MPKIAWIVAFALAAPAAMLAAVVALVITAPTNISPVVEPRVLAAATQVYGYEPGDNSSISAQATADDARALIIRNYLVGYKSPLEPFAQDIVTIADKYSMDPNLLVAIAQQESNLCKRIPLDSHNCWGFGIYGDKVTRFDSYPQAIETVASTLKTKYIDDGLDTPEKIMARYTPPSVEIGGPWAIGVRQFMEELQ
ncbi:MAG: hypothetical protein Q7S31_03965 [bacterium]|nr:hypothetical protein [bacterium]